MEPIEEAVQELKELNRTNKRLLEIQGLQFALDPTRYIARKLRSGEAIATVGAWYQLVAAGDTFTIQQTNPEGYVAIMISEDLRVSQNGVFELTRYVDDGILPQIYIPRATDFFFSWAENLPFSFVGKDMATLICTNHDVADQWLIGMFLLVYLRKDVWEKDSKLMDEAAEKYMHPAVPPPRAPG